MTAELERLVGESLTRHLRDSSMFEPVDGQTGVRVKRLAAAVAADLERAHVAVVEAVPA